MFFHGIRETGCRFRMPQLSLSVKNPHKEANYEKIVYI